MHGLISAFGPKPAPLSPYTAEAQALGRIHTQKRQPPRSAPPRPAQTSRHRHGKHAQPEPIQPVTTATPVAVVGLALV
jgi:hypothetical protein